MEVNINGNAMVIPKKVDTITKLIEHLEINNPVVIVEHNDVILQKETHENTMVQANDRIEFIQFVGGG